MYTEESSDLTTSKRIYAKRRFPSRALNEPYVEKEVPADNVRRVIKEIHG